GGGRTGCERARERCRKQQPPLRREADGHAILPDRAFTWPQCPTGRTPAQSESESRSRRLLTGSHAPVDGGSVASQGREFCAVGRVGRKMTHGIGCTGVAGEREGLAAAAAEIELSPRAARARLLHPCGAAEGIEGRRVCPDIGERMLAHVPEFKAGNG